MKAIPSILALLSLLGADTLHAEARADRAERVYRLWTDYTGEHQLHAVFHHLDLSSNIAYFDQPDGQRIRCPLDQLSEDDRAYLRNLISTSRTVSLRDDQVIPQLPPPVSSPGEGIPNLRMRISEELLASLAQRQVNESTPIRDCILDTAIYGVGWTSGDVIVSLVPCKDRGVFDILFSGTILSDTVGINGPVTIYNDGVTQLISRTRVSVGAKGLSMYATISRAHNQSFTKGLETRFSGLVDWFVRKFAEQRLQRDRPLADAIGASHAQDQFNDRMNEELGEQVRDINDRYRDEVRIPLNELNLFPESLRFSSTAEAFMIHATLNDGQSIDHSAPAATAEADMNVWLHESFVNSSVARALGGKTMSESQVRQDMGDMLGDLNLFEDRPGTTEMRITLDQDRPMTVSYQDGMIVVTLRATEYYLQNSAWPAMDVIIAYRLEQTPAGLKMTRIGNPEIQPPRSETEDDARLGLREILVRRLLANWLAIELKREVVMRDLPLSSFFKEDLGRLTVVDSRTEDGWLMMSINYAAPAGNTEPQDRLSAHAHR